MTSSSDPPPKTETTTTMTLSATYASPTNAPFTAAHDLAAPPSGTADPTVEDKTAYLAALRAAVATLQDDVNRELTRRMDEDKAREAGPGAAVDEAKEEENYGEEEQGDEE